jgi:hypothetical protein
MWVPSPTAVLTIVTTSSLIRPVGAVARSITQAATSSQCTGRVTPGPSPGGPSQILRIKRPTCKNMEIAPAECGPIRRMAIAHRFAFAAAFKLLKGDTIERSISL